MIVKTIGLGLEEKGGQTGTFYYAVDVWYKYFVLNIVLSIYFIQV